MNFRFKNLAQRLLGAGPVAIRPFDEVRAGREKSRGTPQAETSARELAQAPADSCQYHPTESLLGQAPEPAPASGVPCYQANLLAVSPRRRLLSLDDAGVAGEDAVVYCPRERLAIEETVRQWTQPAERHPLLAAPRFPEAQDLPGLSLSLGTLDGGGFYHFLLETLPRLHLARPWLGRIDNFLANGAPGSFHEHWLVHAGVPADKIHWLSGHSHFHCEEVLFTNPLCSDSEPTPWLLSAIRQTMAAPATDRPGSRRIWISRNDASSRVLAWENELLAQLGNFEQVELARLAPGEQMRLMAGAGVVAGPHGAGLSNLIFCAPGTRIIELLPEGRYRPLFGRLAIAAGCPHAWAAVDFTRIPTNLEELATRMRAFAA